MEMEMEAITHAPQSAQLVSYSSSSSSSSSSSPPPFARSPIIKDEFVSDSAPPATNSTSQSGVRKEEAGERETSTQTNNLEGQDNIDGTDNGESQDKAQCQEQVVEGLQRQEQAKEPSKEQVPVISGQQSQGTLKEQVQSLSKDKEQDLLKEKEQNLPKEKKQEHTDAQDLPNMTKISDAPASIDASNITTSTTLDIPKPSEVIPTPELATSIDPPSLPPSMEMAQTLPTQTEAGPDLPKPITAIENAPSLEAPDQSHSTETPDLATSLKAAPDIVGSLEVPNLIDSVSLSDIPVPLQEIPDIPASLQSATSEVPPSLEPPEILASLETSDILDQEPDPMQAFAKLSFPDGDFYVHTYAVELGRDVNAHKHERKLGKQRKRRERFERKEMAERQRRLMEMNQDQDAMDAVSPRDSNYMNFNNSYSAPPMSVSNVSDVGGIMGVNVYSSDSDDEPSGTSRRHRRRRKKKGSNNFISSNSEHSLDPNTLHANPQDLVWDHEAVTPPRGLPEGLPEHAYQCPLIPIHPQTGASFKGISRRHVRIEYNLEQGYWEMFVTGRNTVFHNDDRIETGGSARLHHGSEIIIQTITIIFKLPDNARDDDVQIHELDQSDDSPLSDLADDMEMPSSDDDIPLRARRQPSPPKRRIVKLKFSKSRDKLAQKFPATSTKDRPDKSGKHSAKTSKTDKHDKTSKSEKHPHDKSTKPEKHPHDKATKPDKHHESSGKTVKKDKVESAKKSDKALPKESAEPANPEERLSVAEQPVVSAPETPVMPPPPPAQLSPDVKQTVESDDAAMIAALKSEPGPSETPPAIPAELPAGSVLVGVAPEDIPAKRKGPGRPPKNGVMSKRDEAIIKRLTKELQKQGKMVPSLNDLLLMARAEGSTKKDRDEKYGEDGKPILEGSITPGPSIPVDPSIMQSVEGFSQGTPLSASQTTPDKDAKPKRIIRTPSPQKPESEYTEEELKKPTQTYVVLIHEALSKSPTGIMDLQQIYDAMQKMYPFFKYRAGTSGWQSSVRHNLISSEAFQEAGKIGKGRLWKINPDVPIDKEKKRKAPTPPPQTTPQYPYYPNGQYPYAGPPQHGPQNYSPYARPSPYGTPYGPPAGAQPGSRPPVPPPQQKPGTYYSPYASNPMGGAHASPYGPPSRPPYAAYPPPNQAQQTAGGQPGPSPYGPPQSNLAQGQQPPPGQNQPQSQANGQPPQQAPYPPPPQPNGQYPPQQQHQPPQQQQQQGQYQQQPQQQQQHGQQQSSAPYPPPQNAQHPLPAQNAPQSAQHVPPNNQHVHTPAQHAPPPAQYAPSQSQQPPSQPASAQQPGAIDISKAISNIMNYQQQYITGFALGKESDDARAMFTKAMTRAISAQSQQGGYDSKAEEDLTKKIAEIYAQSRYDAVPPASTQPSAPSGPPQYSSVHPTPSPAPSTPIQHSSNQPPPKPPINTTPAPPQGNIPARYLPPQYNPQHAASVAHPPQPQHQAPPRPFQQSHQTQQQQQQQQQQVQGSASETHLAQALSAYTSPQPATPNTPGNSAAATPYRPTVQTPFTPQPPGANSAHARQSQTSMPEKSQQPPLQQAPTNSGSRPPASALSANGAPAPLNQQPQQAPLASHVQALPATMQQANQGPGAAAASSNAQGPAPAASRPAFTPAPAPALGQQGSKMPPRPTFAPSSVTAPNTNGVPGARPVPPSPAQAAAPTMTGQSQTIAQPHGQSATSMTQSPAPPPPPKAVPNQDGNGGSLKRPIELDDDDDACALGAKKLKTDVAASTNSEKADADNGKADADSGKL